MAVLLEQFAADKVTLNPFERPRSCLALHVFFVLGCIIDLFVCLDLLDVLYRFLIFLIWFIFLINLFY